MRAIITFHSVDDRGTVLSYPPMLFARLLKSLDRTGLPVVDLDTLLASPGRDGISLTFDDGMRSLHDAALPVLRDHGVPSHLFLVSGTVGGINRWSTPPASMPEFEMLGWDELERLQAAGVRIESHTHTHPDMRRLDVPAAEAECEQADALIEKRLGRRPRYFAWPFGHVNPLLLPMLSARYAGLLTTALRTLRSGDPATALPRLDAYYLQHGWLVDRLDGFGVRCWLELRRVLRRVRGGYW